VGGHHVWRRRRGPRSGREPEARPRRVSGLRPSYQPDAVRAQLTPMLELMKGSEWRSNPDQNSGAEHPTRLTRPYPEFNGRRASRRRSSTASSNAINTTPTAHNSAMNTADPADRPGAASVE